MNELPLYSHHDGENGKYHRERQTLGHVVADSEQKADHKNELKWFGRIGHYPAVDAMKCTHKIKFEEWPQRAELSKFGKRSAQRDHNHRRQNALKFTKVLIDKTVSM